MCPVITDISSMQPTAPVVPIPELLVGNFIVSCPARYGKNHQMQLTYYSLMFG
jgi:hypothetical protein